MIDLKGRAWFSVFSGFLGDEEISMLSKMEDEEGRRKRGGKGRAEFGGVGRV